jgi:hypothetical protein
MSEIVQPFCASRFLGILRCSRSRLPAALLVLAFMAGMPGCWPTEPVIVPRVEDLSGFERFTFYWTPLVRCVPEDAVLKATIVRMPDNGFEVSMWTKGTAGQEIEWECPIGSTGDLKSLRDTGPHAPARGQAEEGPGQGRTAAKLTRCENPLTALAPLRPGRA